VAQAGRGFVADREVGVQALACFPNSGCETKPEFRSRPTAGVVGQASCLSNCAVANWKIFSESFTVGDWLEACPTNQAIFASKFGLKQAKA
jgi:hypothetical protein